MIANQFSVIPLLQSVVVNDVAIFRPPTSHFSLTLSMAIIVFLVSNLIAISISPIKYVGNFIRVRKFLHIKSVGDFA